MKYRVCRELSEDGAAIEIVLLKMNEKTIQMLVNYKAIELTTAGIVASLLGWYFGQYDIGYALGFSIGVLAICILLHININRKKKDRNS